MYTLRRINGDGVEMNTSLGNGYTYVNRFESYEAFCKDFQSYFDKKHVADLDEASDDDTKRVYGFVGCDKFIQPLYMNQKAFIVSENGKTFANLSYKG